MKRVTGRSPLRPTYERVIALMGDAPDEERFRKVYEAWCLRGYNPDNLGGQLDWYRDGIPEASRGASARASAEPPPPVTERTPEERARIQALLREARERAESGEE